MTIWSQSTTYGLLVSYMFVKSHSIWAVVSISFAIYFISTRLHLSAETTRSCAKGNWG